VNHLNKVFLISRPNWQEKIKSLGLTYNEIQYGDGTSDEYWNESMAWEFSSKEISIIEDLATALHFKMIAALEYVIEKHPEHLIRMGYTPAFISKAIETWNFEAKGLYGRFDFALKRNSNDFIPVVLEYNAETPTTLLEASIVQWHWLKEVRPDSDQFNFLHEQLIATWTEFRNLAPIELLHLACADHAAEDEANLFYMADVATQSGFTIKVMNMSDICEVLVNGRKVFTDPDGEPIQSLFKLYPWEWMSREEFFEDFTNTGIRVYEPMWRALLSSKALLPILHKLYPSDPSILKAWYTEEEAMASGLPYVKKPVLGREGCGVSIFDGADTLLSMDEIENMASGFIYQERADMLVSRDQADRPTYAIMGVWVVGETACGMGIRESLDKVTNDTSYFVPHYIKG